MRPTTPSTGQQLPPGRLQDLRVRVRFERLPMRQQAKLDRLVFAGMRAEARQSRYGPSLRRRGANQRSAFRVADPTSTTRGRPTRVIVRPIIGHRLQATTPPPTPTYVGDLIDLSTAGCALHLKGRGWLESNVLVDVSLADDESQLHLRGRVVDSQVDE